MPGISVAGYGEGDPYSSLIKPNYGQSKIGMSQRNPQTHLAAAYQLLASYLVWDLHDLLSKGNVTKDASKGRVEQLIEMLDTATRATQLTYPANRVQAGAARGERTERLASLNSDRQLLELIAVAHEDKDLTATSHWAQDVSTVLKDVRRNHWKRPGDHGTQIIKDELQPFLRRLQRIDQFDLRRPGEALGGR